MFRFDRVALSFVLTLASSVAHAGFGTCTLANNALSVGADPVDHVRLAMRADGRPLLAFTTDVHNDSSLYLYACANPTWPSRWPAKWPSSTPASWRPPPAPPPG